MTQLDMYVLLCVHGRNERTGNQACRREDAHSTSTARIKRRQPEHPLQTGCRGMQKDETQTKLRQPEAATFCRTRAAPASKSREHQKMVGD